MTADHWQSVYQAKGEDEVGLVRGSPLPSHWSRWKLPWQRCGQSQRRVADSKPSATARRSTSAPADRSWPRKLLARGWHPVIALDVRPAAIDQLARRAQAAGVAGEHHPGRCAHLAAGPRVGLWHDRAVFHFLTDRAKQVDYAALAARTVVPGGLLIISTFAADGPEQCSGLPTARHDAAPAWSGSSLLRYEMVQRRRQEHRTPIEIIQPFTWAAFGRR
jgi:hypothetical protein